MMFHYQVFAGGVSVAAVKAATAAAAIKIVLDDMPVLVGGGVAIMAKLVCEIKVDEYENGFTDGEKKGYSEGYTAAENLWREKVSG